MAGSARRHDASNEAGTCLWCGDKLRKGRNKRGGLGDYGDGYFCGLRCGYSFGKAFAGFGRRLNPRGKCRG